MMRAAHSLKGAARIVGLDAAVGVAHALEDCFVAVQEGRCRLEPPHIDILLNAVDFINSISMLPENEFMSWLIAHETEVQNVVSSVQSVLNATESAAPSESASPPVPPPPKVDPPRGRAKPPEPAPRRRAGRSRAFGRPGSGRPRRPRYRREPARADGLAGEALVQSRQLRPFVDSLMMLKRQHSALLETLQILLNCADVTNGAASCGELLTLAKSQAGQSWQALNDRMEAFENFARRNEDLPAACITKCDEPHASSRRRRAGFPRLVRDVARQLGKNVKFEVIGETTGVDRDILDKLEAPLNHLIRNCAGPRHRTARGTRRPANRKPARSAWKRATARGCSRSSLPTTAGASIEPARVEDSGRGLATAAMTAAMTEAELLEFLFLPGFSTKDKLRKSPAAASDWMSSRTWCGPSVGSFGCLRRSAGEHGSRSNCRSPCRSFAPCWSGFAANRTPSP